MAAALSMLIFDMRKFLVKLAIFFGLFVGLDFTFGRICNYMFQHAKGGDTRAMNVLIQESERDILVMGSSRAHCHYDDQRIEDSLGVSCYNAGVEGNGIIMMYGIYKLMEHKPRIILYDVEPSFDIYEYNEDKHNSRYISLLKFYNSVEIRDIIRQVDPSLEYKNLSGFYRYNTKFITVFKDFFIVSPLNAYGYEPVYGEITEVPAPRENQEPLLDNTKYHFFVQFINDTKKDGVQLIILASPKYGDDGGLLEPIRNLCAQEEVPFLDFSSEERFQKIDYFKEPMHMNNVGAEMYTLDVINYLRHYESVETD